MRRRIMKARPAPLANAVAKARAAVGRLTATVLTREDLARRALERRAVEAVIWGIPVVNFDAMLQAAARTGAGDNHVVFWSRPCDWRNQTLTPNTDALYSMAFFNTKDAGPMVLEIPPAGDGAIVGTVMDCWQAALEDVGPAGADRGQGGRYLVLPPGHAQPVPDGYIPLRSNNYRGYALLRSIPKGSEGADTAAAAAYARRIQLYPLSAAGAAPRTARVDVTGALFEALIPYDQRFFESLNRMVQDEPWLERDRAMIDALTTIGIEKGRAFAPDADTADTLIYAAGEAHAWLSHRFESAFLPFYPGRRWFLPADEVVKAAIEAYFETPDAYPVDSRGTLYYCAFSSVKRLGAGQFYLFATRDSEGARLDGARSYRLGVPPEVPVRQYWSATAYDFATHGLIRDVPWASRSSLTPGLQRAPDGSTEIHFAPRPPHGDGANWVPTRAGVRFEVLFRFYGPEKELFEKTWGLPDIELVG
jgi:hypothetical protein